MLSGMRPRLVAWSSVAFCIVGCGAKSDLILLHEDVPGTGGAGTQPFAPGTDAGEDVTPLLDSIEYATCGPADGTAFGLILQDGPECDLMQGPPGEFDRIEVWSALPAGFATILVDASSGIAETCRSGVCTQATSARLRIDSAGDGTVNGSYEMAFADGSNKGGPFFALICPSHPLCG
jgi:hypothetical protein